MTEPSDPDIRAAIDVLRHEILASGRQVDWENFRGRIKRLLIEARPSPDVRIRLLQLYDHLATKVEGLRAADLTRVGHQRAVDTVGFALAEAREQGSPSFGEIVDREIAAGRLRVDHHLSSFLTHLLEAIDPGARGPPGVGEDAAPFSFPAGFSRPPATPTSPPWP